MAGDVMHCGLCGPGVPCNGHPLLKLLLETAAHRTRAGTTPVDVDRAIVDAEESDERDVDAEAEEDRIRGEMLCPWCLRPGAFCICDDRD